MSPCSAWPAASSACARWFGFVSCSYSKTFGYYDLPEFTQQTKLTFPVKVVVKKNADGTWAKPTVEAFAPFATYDSTSLPSYAL